MLVGPTWAGLVSAGWWQGYVASVEVSQAMEGEAVIEEDEVGGGRRWRCQRSSGPSGIVESIYT